MLKQILNLIAFSFEEKLEGHTRVVGVFILHFYIELTGFVAPVVLYALLYEVVI